VAKNLAHLFVNSIKGSQTLQLKSRIDKGKLKICTITLHDVFRVYLSFFLQMGVINSFGAETGNQSSYVFTGCFVCYFKWRWGEGVNMSNTMAPTLAK